MVVCLGVLAECTGSTVTDGEEFLGEIETMMDLNHKHLLRMAGVSLKVQPWFVAIEFMQFGDLLDVLKTCREKKVKVTHIEKIYFCGPLLRHVCCLRSPDVAGPFVFPLFAPLSLVWVGITSGVWSCVTCMLSEHFVI